MAGVRRPRFANRLLLVTAIVLLLVSCGSPFEWNADVRSFVEDALTTVSIVEFTAETGGTATSVVPSGSETNIIGRLINPRSIAISGVTSWEDDNLFESPPTVSVQSSHEIRVSLTPSLQAERNDLTVTVQLSAPTLDRMFDPVDITLRCNSCPSCVTSSLDAALDADGRPFTAFRLPSAPTDDDLAQVEIIWMRADSSQIEGTIARPADDAALQPEILTCHGENLLGTNDSLCRYFRPPGATTGDDYIFVVVVIDSEGLRSVPAAANTNAASYTVTYTGNESTGGAAPLDATEYRQTKPATALSSGTLERMDYTFVGWNTLPDGTGTAYAPGDTFSMPAGNVVLYAQWIPNDSLVVTFDLNPAYGSIEFAADPVSVQRGVAVALTASATGAADWRWYLDGVLVPGQTTGAFTWDTTERQPGQYVVSVAVTSGGYPCTGSIRVTVTY